jgi:hypothetical protein
MRIALGRRARLLESCGIAVGYFNELVVKRRLEGRGNTPSLALWLAYHSICLMAEEGANSNSESNSAFAIPSGGYTEELCVQSKEILLWFFLPRQRWR